MKNKTILPITIVGIFIVILIWFFFPEINRQLIGESLKFEEISAHYGAFSALFSALAFIAVIATLIMQSRELQLQRTELKNTVQAQKDSARALEDQARKNLLAIQADSYFKVLDTLQSDEVIKARKIVFSLRDFDTGIIKKYDRWSDSEKTAAEELMRKYDSIGIMAFNEMIPYELIVDSWGSSLRRSWIIVEKHLEFLRNKRNAPEFWDDYEWLVKKAREYETEYIEKKLTYKSGEKVCISTKKII